jgi:hypothetical protein
MPLSAKEELDNPHTATLAMSISKRKRHVRIHSPFSFAMRKYGAAFHLSHAMYTATLYLYLSGTIGTHAANNYLYDISNMEKLFHLLYVAP